MVAASGVFGLETSIKDIPLKVGACHHATKNSMGFQNWIDDEKPDDQNGETREPTNRLKNMVGQ